jgi:hypothetical protein
MVTGKKIALWGCLGCGGIVLIIALLFAGGAGIIAYKAVQFGKELERSYKQVAAGYKALDEQYPFVMPEQGIMDEGRLRAFLRIRGETLAFVRERTKEIEQTGRRIEEQMEGSGVAAKIRGIRTIRDIVNLATKMVADAGQEHLRLLDGDNMSPKEFQWLAVTYLGTLAKAADDNVAGITDAWRQYLDAFGAAQDKARPQNIQIGRIHIRGGDINRETFLRALRRAPYNPSNVELVKSTVEQLLPGGDVGTLDFVAIQLERIIEEIEKGTWDGNLDLDRLTGDPQ